MWSSQVICSGVGRVVVDRHGHPSRGYSEGNNDQGDSSVLEETVPEIEEHDLEELLENIEIAKSGGKIADGVKRSRVQRSSLMNIDELVDFLRGENAQDICVINVPPERGYVDYFVTCTGLGTRHIGKMADSLVEEVSYTSS